METYLWLKMLHLLSLVFWIGPAVGAYIILILAYLSRDAERTKWLEIQTEKILRLEHVAFGLLVLSGLGLWWQHGATDTWLKWKLILFSYIFLFELYDVYLYHFLWRKRIQEGKMQEELKKPLMWMAFPVTLLVPAIFYLAIFKPILN